MSPSPEGQTLRQAMLAMVTTAISGEPKKERGASPACVRGNHRRSPAMAHELPASVRGNRGQRPAYLIRLFPQVSVVTPDFKAKGMS